MRTLGMILIPLALQSYEEAAAKLAEDLAAAANGPSKVAVGDEYVKLLKKFPKKRAELIESASDAYGKAWPDLDAVWKTKTREQLARLYSSPQPATRPMPKGEWRAEGAVVSGERVRSGLSAVKITMPKGNADGYYIPLRTVLKLPAGAAEVEVSAWVLSDGTNNVNDDVKPTVTGAAGKLLYAQGSAIPLDLPIWTKVEKKIACEGGLTIEVQFDFLSRKGTVYVDDVSIKVDGKELLTNGSFER